MRVKKINAHTQIHVKLLNSVKKNSNIPLSCGYATIKWIQVTKL